MQHDYPVNEVPATPEFILEVFQDQHRQSVSLGNSDGDIDLQAGTTIADWRIADDLLGWRGFAVAMNQEWGIDIDLATWKAVLEPAKVRTVGELCAFLAPHVTMPVIRPLEITGLSCRSAGIFLTIRSMLIEEGADPAAIYPSACVEPHLRKHWSLFIGRVSRLAPGSMPAIVNTDPPILEFGLLALWAFTFVLLVLERFSQVSALPAIVACMLVQLFMIVASWFPSHSTAASLELMDVKTFKELSRRMAGGSAVA